MTRSQRENFEGALAGVLRARFGGNWKLDRRDGPALCECGCGDPAPIARATNATWGHVKGQPMRFILGHGNRKHGHSAGGRSPTYFTWESMNARCTKSSTNGYEHYGGRGITVCERWESFENFLADMGERPEGKTLDRIDSEGNYEPTNCQWATASEQVAASWGARRKPGNERRFKPKDCMGCGETFQPTGSRHYYCSECRKSKGRGRQRTPRVGISGASS